MRVTLKSHHDCFLFQKQKIPFSRLFFYFLSDGNTKKSVSCFPDFTEGCLKRKAEQMSHDTYAFLSLLFLYQYYINIKTQYIYYMYINYEKHAFNHFSHLNTLHRKSRSPDLLVYCLHEPYFRFVSDCYLLLV